jgi:predicted RNase H-like HicB family nuclease
MTTSSVEYIVRVHEEDDSSFWAEVLDLPGCFASGDTLDELREALAEAISLYVADDPEAGTIKRMQKAPQPDPPKRAEPMRVGEMRVLVPC